MIHFAFVSCGNDSVALLQWLKNRNLSVHAVYSNTGWSAKSWPDRVHRVREWAIGSGFLFTEISSVGMLELVKKKKAWPRNGMQFCTEELKIRPAMDWLETVDPGRTGTCVVGIRREESHKRMTFPEWVEESEKHGGRSLWAPLVRLELADRNVLCAAAGFEILQTRSQECYPCVNASRSNLRLIDEERIALIEKAETELGFTKNGKPRTMYRPNKFAGAVGIREIVRWANSERGEYEPVSDCDSGHCGG